jgi:2-methylisocitrate lyase-like PEP mutase family enzyme
MNMATQADKGRAFRELHGGAGIFVMPNPWDVGTARLLAHLGFAALATTSAGYAFSVGRADGTIGCDKTLLHVATIASAVDVPVSADLENGFGDDADTVASTIRQAAAAGAVGGSIEDSTGRADEPLYELEHAADRVRAAAEAARGLGIPFVLTARAENFLVGKADIKDTIRRLQAYQEAGADVLYAPGLTSRNEIISVVSSVDRPVNVLMGLANCRFNVAELAEMGVRRVSLGSALSRTALTAFLRAVREIRNQGTFTFSDEAASYSSVNAMFKDADVQPTQDCGA